MVNASFESSTATTVTGWELGGGAVASTDATMDGVVSVNLPADSAGANSLTQTIAADDASALNDFVFTTRIRLPVAPAENTNNARIRLCSASGASLITLSPDATGIRSRDSAGTWADSLTGLQILANQTYHLRVIARDMNLASRSYEIGFSSDGIQWQSARSTRFDNAGLLSLGRIIFDGTLTGLQVDDIAVTPSKRNYIINGDIETLMANGKPATWWVGSSIVESTNPILGNVSMTVPSASNVSTFAQTIAGSAATALNNCELAMRLRLAATPTENTNNCRIKLRGPSSVDLLVLAVDASGLRAYDRVTNSFADVAWTDGKPPIQMLAGTAYHLRVTARNLGGSNRSYDIALSADGTNWKTGSASSFATTSLLGVAGVLFDGTTIPITVDDVSITP